MVVVVIKVFHKKEGLIALHMLVCISVCHSFLTLCTESLKNALSQKRQS